MRVVDVNILVHGHREDHPRHLEYRTWLESAATALEPLGLTSSVLAGFVRIVTNPRVFARPSTVDAALTFVETLRAAPASRIVEPGPRHWSIFADLCRRANATGNLVPDAALAAISIELGATLFTTDRDFARFSGLRWAHPLESPEGA